MWRSSNEGEERRKKKMLLNLIIREETSFIKCKKKSIQKEIFVIKKMLWKNTKNFLIYCIMESANKLSSKLIRFQFLGYEDKSNC